MLGNCRGKSTSKDYIVDDFFQGSCMVYELKGLDNPLAEVLSHRGPPNQEVDWDSFVELIHQSIVFHSK